ncbi:MAG: HAMP domain-containing histidine kinase, partial [Lentisphaeraceae bacterium]|nr:HAMP domain-containing histidine kinase [Lentisphaeraceae bacterium]
MKLLSTLKFRMSFLFAVSLAAVSSAVFFWLMLKLEERSLSVIDQRIQETAKFITRDFNEKMVDLSPGSIPESESILSSYTSQSRLQKEAYFLVYDDSVLLRTSFDNRLLDLDSKILKSLPESSLSQLTIKEFGLQLRALRIQLKPLYSLIIIASLEQHYEMTSEMRELFKWGIAAIIIIGGVIAWLTTAYSMGGVKRISKAALEFGQGNRAVRASTRGEGEEIKDMAKSFNAMAGQIEKLIFEMIEVTNNIAHDLRTPVTRMRGLAENSFDNKDKLEVLPSHVMNECDLQATIIDDILSLSKSEAGVMEIDQEDVDLVELVCDCIDLCDSAIEDSGGKVVFEEPKEKIIFCGDRARTERVLANLIDNSLKYAPEATIVIELWQTHNVYLRIKDNGPGIPNDIRDKVFERF